MDVSLYDFDEQIFSNNFFKVSIAIIMTTTENVDSQKWYKFLLDKNEMNVIINSSR